MHDIDDILKVLPHRYPFAMVDKVLSLVPKKQIHALKNITYNEPCFQGHIPQKPIYPGVYMVEALAQTAGLLLMLEKGSSNKMFLLAKIDNAKFKQLIIPGDSLNLHAEFLRAKSGLHHFKGHIEVGQKLVMQAEFWLAER